MTTETKRPRFSFSISDMTYVYDCGIITITIVTHERRHLYIKYGPSKPEWVGESILYTFGPRLHNLQYLTRTDFTLEQQEPGFTTTHTFSFLWPDNGTRLYFYFINLNPLAPRPPTSPIYALDLEIKPDLLEGFYPPNYSADNWTVTGYNARAFFRGPTVHILGGGDRPDFNWDTTITRAIDPPLEFNQCDQWIAIEILSVVSASPVFHLSCSLQWDTGPPFGTGYTRITFSGVRYTGVGFETAPIPSLGAGQYVFPLGTLLRARKEPIVTDAWVDQNSKLNLIQFFATFDTTFEHNFGVPSMVVGRVLFGSHGQQPVKKLLTWRYDDPINPFRPDPDYFRKKGQR